MDQKKIHFLFWNINGVGATFESKIFEIVENSSTDVLILSEANSFTITNQKFKDDYNEVSLNKVTKNSVKKWVRVFYKKNRGFNITHKSEFSVLEDEKGEDLTETKDISEIKKFKEVNRIQLFELKGEVVDTLFAAIHFPSKLYHDEASHTEIVPIYKRKIHALAQENKRIFIVGDFNMNPFDLGMLSPTCFYSFHNRELIETDSKSHISGSQPMYYNPCWTLLGDFISNKNFIDSKRNGGSFYYEEKRESKKLYYYLLDQIIMRKVLIDEFDSSSLKLLHPELLDLDNIGKVKGLTANKSLDHLPIFFAYDFKTK